MTVEKDEFEASLASLRASVRDPRAGIFGPGSMTWRVSRESIVFLGGGRAALLQTAHPFVAHGVDQHSATKTDPFGRFLRTFDAVFAMVFGDLDHALQSARHVHAIHRRIVGTIGEDVGRFRAGTPYEANDEDALLWVAATLWDTAIQCYELAVRPLSDAEKARYYDECRLFAALFGIPGRVLPADWPAFRRYFEETCASDTIAVGRPAAEIARFVLNPPRAFLAPLGSLYTTITTGLLPPRIRYEYGLPFGRLERGIFDAAVRAIRASYGALPPSARYLPVYANAMARVAGRKENVVSRAVNRAFTAAARRSMVSRGRAKAAQARSRAQVAG